MSFAIIVNYVDVLDMYVIESFDSMHDANQYAVQNLAHTKWCVCPIYSVVE